MSDILILYSDDSVEDVILFFEGIDVEIELNQLSFESRAILQGPKVVKGVLIESKDDLAPTIALGFKYKKTYGKYRYFWILKGKFELVSDEYVEGMYVRIINGWFTAVPEEPVETI